MKTIKQVLVLCSILSFVALTGCTSTLQNKIERNVINYSNRSAQILCYSGGQLIYQGKSIGKVTDDEDSDGFFWRDKEGFVEMNADCIFRYSEPVTQP